MADPKSMVGFRTDERVWVQLNGTWTAARYIRRQHDGSHFVHLNATHGAVMVTDENIRHVEDE